MKRTVYFVLQICWGLPQTLCGLLLFAVLLLKGCPHFDFRCAVATEWTREDALSLGPFLFIPCETIDKNYRNYILLHEYGHTLQSLLLGPLFFPLIGLPSVFWCQVPFCGKSWRSGKRSYYSFYTEKTANRLSGAVAEERFG